MLRIYVGSFEKLNVDCEGAPPVQSTFWRFLVSGLALSERGVAIVAGAAGVIGIGDRDRQRVGKHGGSFA